MSALFYLALKKGKNKLVELLHKPLKLIAVLGFVFLLVMNFTLSQGTPSGDRSLHEFRAIILAFYILCFITESRKGFHSGGSMFSLADVSLMFTSPLKPVIILFNGMLSRLGSSLFVGVAFVYQFVLLRSFYPITVHDILASVVGYGAVVFVSQLVGMLIYFFTCGQKEKIKIGKALLYSVCGAFFLAVALRFVTSDNYTLSGFSLAFTSLIMRFFPVAGWIFTAVDGFMLGDELKLVFGILPCVAFTATVFVLLVFSKRGYYEDVVLSAEKNDNAKNEGRAAVTVSVREGDRGFVKGEGASAFFYKHLIENQRTKTSLFSAGSTFYIVLLIVYSFVLKADAASLFAMSCTASVLTVIGGRWVKELTLPYIYLVPEKSIKKLFFLLPEMLPKVLTESAVHCALITVLCKTGVRMLPVFFLARVSFCFVVMASALLTARFFREKEKNNVFAAMCIAVSLVFSAPSVLLSVAVASFGFGIFIALLVMSAMNIIVGAFELLFARKLLII